MKELKVFEAGDKVRIDVEVMGLVMDHGEVQYVLKNPQTGVRFDFTFAEGEIHPIEESK